MANSYQVTLTWPSYPHQGTIVNLVVRRDNVVIATLPASATSFVDDGSTVQGPVLPLATYDYTVTVVFNNGCPARAAADIVNVPCLALDAQNVALDAGADGTVFVTWNPPAPLPFFGYTVAWGTTMGGPYPNSMVIANPDAISATVTGLTPDTQYFFVVQGMDAVNCASPGANEQSVTTQYYGISWEPANVSLPELVGKEAFNTNPALVGVTNLVISDTTNREGYDLENTQLTTLSFPNLVSLTDRAYIFINNSTLTTISFGALTTVNVSTSNGVEIQTCNSLTLISGLNNGVTWATAPFIHNNNSLTSLNLSNSVFNVNATIVNNPVLSTLTITGATLANNGSYIFSGNALNQASVDGVLAMAVANAGYTSGVIDLSGGTSSAPSAAGLANKAILVGRGVAVNNN